MGTLLNKKNARAAKDVPLGAATILAGQTQPMTLPEGYSLTAKGGVGTVILVDPAQAGNVAKQTWVITSGATINTGAFSGVQQLIVNCTTGSIDATVQEASVTQNGSSYTLPIASPSTLGGMKPDNVTITVDQVTGVATATPSGGSTSSETFSIVGTDSVSTVLLLTSANAGTTTTPASYACTAAYFHKSPVPWEYQLNGAGAFYKVRANERKMIRGITNANQIGVRRSDYAVQRAKFTPNETETSQVQTLRFEYGTVTNPVANFSVSNRSLTLLGSANAPFGRFACSAFEFNNCGFVDVVVKANAYGRGNGSVTAGVLTQTSLADGMIMPGQSVVGGTLTATKITAQLTSTEAGGALGGTGTYQLDTNQTAASVFLNMTTPGAGIVVERGETRMFTGLLNAAQISVQSFDSSSTPVVQGEAFGAVPTLARREFVVANGMDREAVAVQGELTLSDNEAFSVPASFTSKTMFNPNGRHISMFNLAANTVVTNATAADVSVSAGGLDYTTAFSSRRTQYATPTQVQVTVAAGAVATIMSTLNTPVPLDCSGGLYDIHQTIKLISGSFAVSGSLVIDLFSAGTPASPGTDFHTLYVGADNGYGFSVKNNFGARSYSAHHFAASGAGANLAAITMMRFRVTGPTGGCVVSPEGAKIVKKGSTKATDVYTVDDGYSSAVNDGMLLMAPYGKRMVVYPSPSYRMGLFSLPDPGSMTFDNYLVMQNNFGYQIALQDFKDETNFDMTVPQWVKSQLKNKAAMVGLGFNPEGLDDCSGYGGGAGYSLTDAQRKAYTRIGATSRSFNNGSGGLGCLFMGTISANTLTVQSVTSGTLAIGQTVVGRDGVGVGDDVKITAGSGTSWTVSGSSTVGTSTQMAADATPPFAFPETNPPGDPFNIKALNFDGSWATTSDLLLYAKYRLHMDSARAAKGIAIYATHGGWGNTNVRLAMTMLFNYQTRVADTQNLTLVELRKQQSTAALREV